MYARVWKLGIVPGNIEKFAAAVSSIRPLLRRQPGFCGLLVLRTGPGEGLEATVISTWASIDALRNSETLVLKQALVDFQSHCEPHPLMREEEVLVSEFPSSDPDDTVTNF
jgi:antibiotic biosynthesis monooxygenase (ABM) superfamily enzyme